MFQKCVSNGNQMLPVQAHPISTGCTGKNRVNNLHVSQRIAQRGWHRLLFEYAFCEGISHIAIVIAGIYDEFFALIVALDQYLGRGVSDGAEWNRKEHAAAFATGFHELLSFDLGGCSKGRGAVSELQDAGDKAVYLVTRIGHDVSENPQRLALKQVTG